MGAVISAVGATTDLPQKSTAAPAPIFGSGQGPTTITSDQFRLDMAKKEGVFLGSVEVTGEGFYLKSRELQLFFGADSKIERMIARGEVEMKQANRTTHSNQAEYILAEDKIILTESPEVIQDRNRIIGNVITIYRTANKMEIDGRSRVLLYDSMEGSGKK